VQGKGDRAVPKSPRNPWLNDAQREDTKAWSREKRRINGVENRPGTRGKTGHRQGKHLIDGGRQVNEQNPLRGTREGKRAKEEKVDPEEGCGEAKNKKKNKKETNKKTQQTNNEPPI